MDTDLTLDTAHAKFMARSKRRVRHDAVSKMAEGRTRLAAEAQVEADKSDPSRTSTRITNGARGSTTHPFLKSRKRKPNCRRR